MNYYPYMNMMSAPYVSGIPAKTGLFSKLFKGLNFSSFLNGTGKVLNIANQAIPLIKQAKPVINNAKTMFQVMNEFKKIDNSSNNTIQRNTNINNQTNGVINNILNNEPTLINTQSTIKKADALPTFFQ